MEDLRQIVQTRLMALKEAIQSKMASEGVNASGRTSESLTVRQNENKIELVKVAGNNAPMATLEVGVGGGVVEATPTFRQILFQWSKDKGISLSDREREVFAWFLSKRIEREGTLRHSNNIDIYSSLVAETIQDLKKSIREECIKAIKQHNK